MMTEKTPIADLTDYVLEHAERGTCRRGKCFDHPGTDRQPTGHTADLVFFEVSARDADPVRLRQLVSAATAGYYQDLDLLDGEEHGYIDIGGWIGDQGLALQLMGLGTVLGLWRLITPKTFGFPAEMVLQMAGMGLVTIVARSNPDGDPEFTPAKGT